MFNLGFAAGVDERGWGRNALHFSVNVPLLLNLVVKYFGLTSETVPLILRGPPTKCTRFLAEVVQEKMCLVCIYPCFIVALELR